MREIEVCNETAADMGLRIFFGLLVPPVTKIVTIADRPDLAPVVADWIWHEWDKNYGHPLSHTLDGIEGSTSRRGPQQTFVLLVDGVPIGTSSLVAHDLDERPRLSPWLAGVFVAPEWRRRGHVIPLIQAVEAATIAASVVTLWLHTEHAKRIYARAGWQELEVVQRKGRAPVMLMRRDLNMKET